MLFKLYDHSECIPYKFIGAACRLLLRHCVIHVVIKNKYGNLNYEERVQG